MNPELSLGPAFRKALERLDYRTVAAQAGGARTDLERYLAVRATFILGRKDEARALLQGHAPAFRHPFFAEFLAVQGRVYEGQDLGEAAVALCALREIPLDAYTQAEVHFFLGYTYHCLHEFKQGSRHHRIARDRYLEAGLPAQAAVALFNLCVGANHLNARELYLAHAGELKALVTRIDLPSTTALSLQLEATTLAERDEYDLAAEKLERLLALSIEDDRMREAGTAAWNLAYVLAKAGRDDALEAQLSRLASVAGRFTVEHQRALEIIGRLSRAGLVTLTGARRMAREWLRDGGNEIIYFHLLDLAVDSLVRAQDYEGARQIAGRAKEALVRSQQALSLVDFRYAEALALARLGDVPRARRALSSYRADALERGAAVRVARADALFEEMTRADRASHDEEGLVLSLNTLSREVRIGETRVPLAEKPRLFELLAVLAQEGKPIALPILFFRLYGQDYHPLRHERRMNSLLDRARKLLGRADAIRRQDFTVTFAPGVEVSLETPPATELAVQWRRRRLLEAVRAAEGPIAISRLERQFEVTRRTLQLDLDYLVKRGLMRTTGGTRGRKYYVEETDEQASEARSGAGQRGSVGHAG